MVLERADKLGKTGYADYLRRRAVRSPRWPLTFGRFALDGVLSSRPQRFGDDRGFFSEAVESGRDGRSRASPWISSRTTTKLFGRQGRMVRGLHFQLVPVAQDNCVGSARGAV